MAEVHVQLSSVLHPSLHRGAHCGGALGERVCQPLRAALGLPLFCGDRPAVFRRLLGDGYQALVMKMPELLRHRRALWRGPSLEAARRNRAEQVEHDRVVAIP